MEKKIKKQVLAKPQTIYVEPPAGLAKQCRAELEGLLKQPIIGAKFEAVITEDDKFLKVENIDYRVAMELVYRCLTPRNIWLQIQDSHVGSFGDLTKSLAKVSWEFFLPQKTLPQLEVQSFKSKLYHEGKIKELLQEQLGELAYKKKDDKHRLQLIQKSNRMVLLLSMAGDDLYKRGFKSQLATAAPLAEHLAAGLLWDFSDYEQVFVPFAGSGTLGFEAMFQALPMAPVNLGRYYSLEDIPATPQPTVNYLKKQLSTSEADSLKLTFIDLDAKQCAEIKANCKALSKVTGYQGEMDVLEGDFFNCATDHLEGQKVLLPLNPPYGIRLGQKSQGSVVFYSKMADRIVAIRKACAQLQGFCLIPDEDSYKALRQIIGELYWKTEHINQGGRHIRALYFKG